MAGSEQKIAKDADKLARLKEQLQKRKRQQVGLMGDALVYRQKNKIEFFTRPNPPQEELLEAWEIPRFKVFTFTGGNRLGKTTIGTIIGISTMAGKWPWNNKKMHFPHKKPRKVRYIGQDWEKHIRSVVVPALKEWWPNKRIKETRKNQHGIEATWLDTETGSTLEIMSNKQEVDLHEGWEGDLIIYDEPPKRDIRIANARGLIDRQGRELFTATLLKEAWIDRDIIKAKLEDGRPDPSVFNVHGEIYDNVGYGLTIEGVEEFRKKLKPEEVEARIKGIPSYMSGLILKNWKTQVHSIEPFTIPCNWIVDVAIDTHPRKKQAIMFMATDERNFRYVFREDWNFGSGQDVGDRIVRAFLRYQLRIENVICDPLAKGDKNNPNTTYDKIANKLSPHGIVLTTATKDKESGILEINNHLLGPNKRPSLFVFNNCMRTIVEAEGWMYDDNGVPVKEDDDFMENLYRLLLLDTIYYDQDENAGADEVEDTVNDTTGY